MKHYRYLIVGGGMTAAAAVQGIREVEKDAHIGIISAEQNPPYDRPPLTKKLWQGKPEESIWRKVPETGIEIILDQQADSIDPAKKQVRTENGNMYEYEKLLLATGGSPRRLPFGDDVILYYRTLADYHQVRQWTGQEQSFGIIGGGFIGSELAASLSMNGEDVHMLFMEDGIGGRIFPAELASFLNNYYREKGVQVYPGYSLDGLERQGDQIALNPGSGQSIVVDKLIAGLGIQANDTLAQSAGIRTDNGILVNQFLQTNQQDIFAAGDVANFYNPALGKRIRVEHEDNANTMGRIAGYNMAGREEPYEYLPFFYSDLFDLGYEAIGDLDTRLETYADWKEPFQKGVVYYLDNGRVRGVLLWNTWDQVDAARNLIEEERLYEPSKLKGRLPE